MPSRLDKERKALACLGPVTSASRSGPGGAGWGHHVQVIEQHMAIALAGMPQVCPKTGVPDSDEEAEPEAYQA